MAKPEHNRIQCTHGGVDLDRNRNHSAFVNKGEGGTKEKGQTERPACSTYSPDGIQSKGIAVYVCGCGVLMITRERNKCEIFI